MAIIQTLSIVAATNATSSTIVGTLSDTGGVLDVIDKSYPESTTDTALEMAFTTAGLQSIYLVASTDTTLVLNPSGTPQTISLLAGKPFSWSASSAYMANPITGDVTDAQVTCADASRLQGRILST